MNTDYLNRKLKGLKRQIRSTAHLVMEPVAPIPDTTAPVYKNGNAVINYPKHNKAKISFNGRNNILFFESSDMTFDGLHVTFQGDNAIVYISEHSDKNRKYQIKMYVQGDSTVYIGKDTNFHIGRDALSYIVASEGKNIIIGDDCLFSLGEWFRTSDGHAAYDALSKKRLNHGKSILIGDHVWIGQDVTILKGTQIGSGSIIGAGSMVTGKKYPSNSSIAGTPARVLKQYVFFNKPNINSYSGEQLANIDQCDTDEWIYEHDNQSTLDFDTIDKGLLLAKTSHKKLAYIKKCLVNNRNKNRFFIG